MCFKDNRDREAESAWWKVGCDGPITEVPIGDVECRSVGDGDNGT